MTFIHSQQFPHLSAPGLSQTSSVSPTSSTAGTEDTGPFYNITGSTCTASCNMYGSFRAAHATSAAPVPLLGLLQAEYVLPSSLSSTYI